jgi:hypothetical protein
MATTSAAEYADAEHAGPGALPLKIARAAGA